MPLNTVIALTVHISINTTEDSQVGLIITADSFPCIRSKTNTNIKIIHFDLNYMQLFTIMFSVNITVTPLKLKLKVKLKEAEMLLRISRSYTNITSLLNEFCSNINKMVT